MELKPIENYPTAPYPEQYPAYAGPYVGPYPGYAGPYTTNGAPYPGQYLQYTAQNQQPPPLQYIVQAQPYPGRAQVVHARQQTNKTLVTAAILSFVALVLASVAIATPYWLTFRVGHMGIWKMCSTNFYKVCLDTGSPAITTVEKVFNFFASFFDDGPQTYGIGAIGLTALKGAACGGVALVGLSFLLIMIALCHNSPKCCANAAGVLLIFASICLSACVGVYVLVERASEVAEINQSFLDKLLDVVYDYLIDYGYSFYLCAAADGITFIAAISAYVGACAENRAEVGAVIIA